MRISYAPFCLSVTALLSGCVTLPTVEWKSDPEIITVEKEQFTAQLKPICSNGYYGGCKAFVLSIVNKSDTDIEVNWNKTLYISGGQTSGGFMFEGVVYKDRNNPKSSDIVFGKGTLTKTIWPNNLVHFESGKYGGWAHQAMPHGGNGAYLSLSINGKEFNERMLGAIFQSQSQPPAQ